MRRPLARLALAIAAAAIVSAAACGSNSNESNNAKPDANGSTPSGDHVTLHLAYFPNITHAPGFVGVARGTFAHDLGPNVDLKTTSFNAGPDEINALLGGSIDIGYIGSGPAVNGYIKSHGDLILLAGATSGGASLIVRPDSGITLGDPSTLAKKKIASPQLGNTQDVALRAYLAGNGLNAQEQGGNVQVIPSANSDTLNLFKQGSIDGAWAPEPWATRLVQEAGGQVFLDERSLWPDGKFLTAVIIARKKFVDDHPDVVKNLLKAHVETIQWIEQNPAEAQTITNDAIDQLTQASLAPAVIQAAWGNLRFTYEPLGTALRKAADDAYELKFLDSQPDLRGIYILDPLNSVLQGLNLPAVTDQ